MASGLGASLVPAGTMPSLIWRASVLLAQRVPALVELSLVLRDPLLRDVGGAWVASGAKYMKNGRSGVSAFWNLTQAIALSVMSVMKW